MPLISILIPCFNNANWIARAIESALAQDYGNIEVIVLDDGSTDESLNVVQTFRGSIQIVTGPNRGGNPARNRLLSMARGDWVQFLDGDDWLLPDKISKQLGFISQGVDAVYGSVRIEWWKDGSIPDVQISTPDPEENIYSHWLNWQLGQTGAVLWRASSIRSIGGWNEHYPCCQDNEICLRALKSGLVFKQSHDAGAVYRIWSSNTISRKDPTTLVLTKSALMDEMIDWLKTHGKLEQKHLDLSGRVFFRMARSLAGYDTAAASEYVEARLNKGLFSTTNEDAPFLYHILFKFLGFSKTEKLAHYGRRFLRPLIKTNLRTNA